MEGDSICTIRWALGVCRALWTIVDAVEEVQDLSKDMDISFAHVKKCKLGRRSPIQGGCRRHGVLIVQMTLLYLLSFFFLVWCWLVGCFVAWSFLVPLVYFSYTDVLLLIKLVTIQKKERKKDRKNVYVFSFILQVLLRQNSKDMNEISLHLILKELFDDHPFMS